MHEQKLTGAESGNDVGIHHLGELQQLPQHLIVLLVSSLVLENRKTKNSSGLVIRHSL